MADGTGTYRMELDHGRKVLVAFAEGFFSMEQGQGFINEFVKSAKEASKFGDYCLLIDAKGVKPSTPDVAEALGEAMKLYISDEFRFRKRFMTRLTSAVTQAQVDRLSRSIPGFSEKMTWVDNKEEALKLM